MSIAFNRDMPEQVSWKVLRVRMWEMGHSFDEIDAMHMDDVGDIVGYWTGKNRGESKLAEEHKRLTSN